MAKSLSSVATSILFTRGKPHRTIRNLNTMTYSKLSKLATQNFSLLKRSYCAQVNFTPMEASKVIRASQVEAKPDEVASPIKGYDKNVLASNTPIEDSHAEGILKGENEGMIFGVFDGHGGPHCGQVVSKRLFSYVAAQFLTLEELHMHIRAFREKDESDPYYSIVKASNDDFEFVIELQELYNKSYLKYLEGLQNPELHQDPPSVEERLQAAFVALDNDISEEVFAAQSTSLKEKTESVASSGAVAAIALVQGNDLHIASTGDCRVVLGQLNDNDLWIAKRLTVDHNADNTKELKRIGREHPGEKQRNIIRGDRLLGMLAPLRAFGDYRFKWPAKTIMKIFGEKLGESAVPLYYESPPYLTAEPEITSLKLSSRDRFMVIGTDGLWDLMTPMQVIRLAGEHMFGKIVLTPLDLSDRNDPIQLRELRDILRHRQAAMKIKPTDANAATHLIRNALGGSAYGVDHSKLATMLTLPKDMVRMFRDDITLQVVFFDPEVLVQGDDFKAAREEEEVEEENEEEEDERS